MDKSELDRRVEEEAGKAFERWIGDAVGGAQWAALDEPERVDWRDVVRPLVERIVELEQAPAKVDAAQGETLVKRVDWHAAEAAQRYDAPLTLPHVERWKLAVGPLVAANMGLESDLKTARDSGQVYADEASSNRKLIAEQRAEIGNLRAHLTAAQTAGRDQASELEKAWAAVGAFKADAERLKGALADANEVIKDERETVRKLLSDNAALETTVDVLAGRLAARGQS